ncbi:glycosyltransferase family 4 protein [Pseudogracilibacillus sp. ICA-222130]|uniref:glycosyltransferase family 4 protein n=1 Tax=Pseudogracilibacillus sp. ICA-222130 TaxID=3134655 RepID=UPI0030C3B457
MKVALIAIRTSDKKLNRYELIKLLQSKGYQVSYFAKKSEGKIHSDYNDYNVRFIESPLLRANLNPIKEIKVLISLLKIFKREQFDSIVVYGINIMPSVIIAAKLSRIKNIIAIVNGSGRLFKLKGIKGFFIKSISYPLLKLSFKVSKHVFVQNLDDIVLLKKKHLLSNNYSHINGSGVNIERFKYTSLKVTNSFTMISRLTGLKGVNEFLYTAKNIKLKYPEVRFNLIGPMDNDDKSINITLFEECIQNGIVNYYGEVENVKKYLVKTSVFVLPSYYPEGVPRAILEAMSVGRPIITTNSPGCRETVINGENGFLIEPKSIEDLTEKVEWMIKNENCLKHMGLKSRELCEKKFDVNLVNKDIVEKID